MKNERSKPFPMAKANAFFSRIWFLVKPKKTRVYCGKKYVCKQTFIRHAYVLSYLGTSYYSLTFYFRMR